MDMVFNATYAVAFGTFVADEFCHVGEEPISCIFVQKRFAVFRAENDVHEIHG
jgi:hypothetical protein